MLHRVRYVIACSLPLPLLLGLPAAAQPEGAAEPASAEWYRQTLALLRSSDEVIPPAVDAHPLTAMFNREAIIPPQCYTQTEGHFNPCYVCHQNERPGRENTMNDGDLQIAYSFSDVGLTNRWSNLFEDRTERVAGISDAEILAYVDEDNYSELAPRLEEAGFLGFIPDLKRLEEGAAAFDELGFALDGSGWVAFNYKPLPSTFWPTNGSTDDVMIRLPEVYRQAPDGSYSRDVYLANLSIVEANVKGMKAITTPPIDERAVGRDLDGNGSLSKAALIADVSSYVGNASGYLFLEGLYPHETEFLHTVRYVGLDSDGGITYSRRMKEVRYMRKHETRVKRHLEELYREEGYAKDAGYLPGYINRREWGLDNGMGWVISGFIEDSRGRLRVNTYEETMFCMGCHTSIGSTIDKTFSFPRKVDGADGWGYIDLRGMPDAPNVGETRGEIETYFDRVGGGGEFRSNPEMEELWFEPGGSVAAGKVRAADVYTLTAPSPERALELNKAYRAIVEDQDFMFGRDATVTMPENVYEQVDNETAPTLPADRFFEWDIRLDWPAVR